MYDVILFDLDGTLTDTGLGVTNAAAYALEQYGITVLDRTELERFVGPPLHESFMRFYGFSEEQAFEAVEVYREYYRDKGLFENTIYNGMEAVLKQLSEAGKTLLVATSKPEVFARRILEKLGIADYFTYIAGANLDGTRTKKAEVIAYVLREGGIEDGTKAVMVGDREYDIFGAREFGMDSIGVLFGYGSRGELEAAGATYIAESVEDIWEICG
ncbi:MAG: HAD family hydrolase [Lachnospiraceae bacterium]|nr:HAD family hydrolase [Lachnospiraceae bacterium]